MHTLRVTSDTGFTPGDTDDVDTMSQALRIPNTDSRSAEFTIYGRIPAVQDVSAGVYFDTVQLTILY
jgi:spore coat protein U-like protein